MLSKNFHPLKTQIDVYQLEKHAHVQHNVPLNVQVKTYTLHSQISLKIIWIHHRTVNQFNSIWFLLLLYKNTNALPNPSNPACWSPLTREAGYMLTVTNSYCLPNLSINDSGNSLHIKGTRDLLQMHRDAWNIYCQKIYFSWRTYIYHQVDQICCSFVCEASMYILFKCLFYKCMRPELGHHYERICPSNLSNIRQKNQVYCW